MALPIPILRRAADDGVHARVAEPPQAAHAGDNPEVDGNGVSRTGIVPVTAVQPAAPGSALTLADGTPMGALTQLRITIRHILRLAGRQGRRWAEQEGGIPAAFLAAKPRSINEQRAYLAERRWLPDGHEGGITDRIGEAYQVAIGVPGVALSNAFGLTFKHGYRFTGVTAVALFLLFAGCKWLLWLPVRDALAVPALIAATVIGWIGLVGLVLAGRRAATRRPAVDDPAED
jgi:hypothetical protein